MFFLQGSNPHRSALAFTRRSSGRPRASFCVTLGTNLPGRRLNRMRRAQAPLLLFILVAAGCSAPRAVPPVEPSQTATTTANDSALSNFIVPGSPAATAIPLLEDSGSLRWLEPPIPYTVQQMSYQDAHKYVPMLSSHYPPASPLRPETPVYLVAVRGRWEMTPMGPPGAAPIQYK